MEIVALSDIHGELIEVPKCDVVCICGDISPLHIQGKTFEMTSWLINEFYRWAESLDCKHVIYIPGNHDFILERFLQNHEAKQAKGIFTFSDKVIMLSDSGVTIDGVRFYGTPHCPDLKRWAFYGDHEKLVEEFSKIPECDVLLTHCPPKISTLGVVLQRDIFNYNENYGCKELADAIKGKVKKLLLCGHVHSGQHNPMRVDDCLMVNCSIKDEDYEWVYQPKFFEI